MSWKRILTKRDGAENNVVCVFVIAVAVARVSFWLPVRGV